MIEEMKTDIDFHVRPLLNPENFIYNKETSDIRLGLPVQKDCFKNYVHIRHLSLFETEYKVPSLSSLGLLQYFNGKYTLRQIYEEMKKKYSQLGEQEFVDRIKMLYSSGIIYFI